VSSVEMVQTYVAHGYGIGVMVHLPELIKLHPEVRVLPLPEFDRVTFGALWQGRKSALMEGMMQLLKGKAREVSQAATS
jgi:DNA-binding transcriptional LysR family regulator